MVRGFAQEFVDITFEPGRAERVLEIAGQRGDTARSASMSREALKSTRC